jgi:sulfate transport system substrate-binding protein
LPNNSSPYTSTIVFLVRKGNPKGIQDWPDLITGDVLLAWENEALLAGKQMGPDAFDIVWPSISVLAEPPVALVDSVVDRKGTRAVAEAYLDYLYTPEGQDIVARNFFRPTNAEVAGRYLEQFPKIRMFTVDDVFGGWARAQAEHFADGGIYDRLFQAAAGASRRP